MNDKVIEEILAAAGAMADWMQSLFENINDAFEQVGDIIGIWANEYLHRVFEFAELDYGSLFQDEPIPGVEPVDYVQWVRRDPGTTSTRTGYGAIGRISIGEMSGDRK